MSMDKHFVIIYGFELSSCTAGEAEDKLCEAEIDGLDFLSDEGTNPSIVGISLLSIWDDENVFEELKDILENSKVCKEPKWAALVEEASNILGNTNKIAVYVYTYWG